MYTGQWIIQLLFIEQHKSRWNHVLDSLIHSTDWDGLKKKIHKTQQKIIGIDPLHVSLSLFHTDRDSNIVKTFFGHTYIYIYIIKHVIYCAWQYSRRYYLRANVSSFRRVRTRRIIISESNEPSNGPPLPPRAPRVLHIGRIRIFFFPSKITIIAPCPELWNYASNGKKLLKEQKKNQNYRTLWSQKSSKTPKFGLSPWLAYRIPRYCCSVSEIIDISKIQKAIEIII